MARTRRVRDNIACSWHRLCLAAGCGGALAGRHQSSCLAPRLPNLQRKKRTHVPDAEDPAKKGQPKSFVFRRGRHGAILRDLERDLRKVGLVWGLPPSPLPLAINKKLSLRLPLRGHWPCIHCGPPLSSPLCIRPPQPSSLRISARSGRRAVHTLIARPPVPASPQLMAPNTASSLKESKRNQIKDFLHVAGPLGVTHFLVLTATHNASYLRIAK